MFGKKSKKIDSTSGDGEAVRAGAGTTLTTERDDVPVEDAAEAKDGAETSFAGDEKVSEEKATDAKATSEKAANEKAANEKAANEKAGDAAWTPGRRSPAKTPASLRGGPEAVPEERRTDDVVPGPDDEAKPTGPTQLPKGSWSAALRRTVREFGDDKCTDLGAGLTYYSVLSVFPALLALFSILGVVGQGQKAVDQIVKVLYPLMSHSTVDDRVRPVLDTLVSSKGASITLVVGLLGALWSASGYVGAFSRAMNRIYEVSEGRPVWKLRPQQLLLTLVTVVLCACSLVILVVSGPVATSLGDRLGVGDTLLSVWTYAKWPVLAILVILVVGLLYYFTPNVKQPRFRWVSVGAFIAILVWVAASVGFAFYVGNFGSYNKTYGSVAGVVIALLWIWLTNVALLFGAELDSELERSRQLQAGMPAEEVLQLPVRDARGIEKAKRKREQTIERARRVRLDAWESGDPSDRPFAKGRPKK